MNSAAALNRLAVKTETFRRKFKQQPNSVLAGPDAHRALTSVLDEELILNYRGHNYSLKLCTELDNEEITVILE